MADFSWVSFGSIFLLILAVTLTLMWVMPKMRANREQSQGRGGSGVSDTTVDPGQGHHSH